MDRSTDTLAASAAALAHGGDLDQTLSTLLGAAAGATGALRWVPRSWRIPIGPGCSSQRRWE